MLDWAIQGVRRHGSISYDKLTANKITRFTPITLTIGPQVPGPFLKRGIVIR